MDFEKYTERSRGFIQSASRWPCGKDTSASPPNIF